MLTFQKRIYGFALSILVITTFMLHPPAFAGESLKIGGSGSALGVMKMLGLAFEKKHPDIKVEVLPSLGSSGGIKAVSKMVIDIGLSGRPLKSDEQNPQLEIIEYAKTPFIFIANKDVDVTTLSQKEIERLYSGDTLTWPDGKQIRLILRAAYESDTITLKSISPEISKAVDAALSRKGLVTAMTDQETADLIEKTPGAVGTSTLTLITTEKRQVKVLSYNKSYPIYKSLYMVISTRPSEKVKQFLDFIKSSEGKNILAKGGCLAAFK